MKFMKKSKQQVSVILNADVPDIGFAGELLVVRPGFARNFLLPRGHAELATPAKVAQRETEIAKAEQRRASEVTEREALATEIAAEPLQLKLKVGPDKRIFGSVTATEVVKQLKAQRKLELTTQQLSGLPIKHLGRHQASAKLGLGVTATITLEIEGEPVKPAKEDSADKPTKRTSASKPAEATT